MQKQKSKVGGSVYRKLPVFFYLRVVMWDFFKIFCFLTWIIFKVFIEFATILFLFYVLVFWPRDMCDRNSLIRDQTCTPCIGKVKSQPLERQGSPSRQFWSPGGVASEEVADRERREGGDEGPGTLRLEWECFAEGIRKPLRVWGRGLKLSDLHSALSQPLATAVRERTEKSCEYSPLA